MDTTPKNKNDLRCSTPVSDPALVKRAQDIVNADPECSQHTDYNGPITQLFKHTVVPNVWGAVTLNGGGYVFFGALEKNGRVRVDVAFDTFDPKDPGFFSATLRDDETWTYEEEPEGDRPYFSLLESNYDVFSPGDTLYPILFIPSFPSGWLVSNASGTTMAKFWEVG